MSHLTDLFSIAFKDLTEKDASFYPNCYDKYMGIKQVLPFEFLRIKSTPSEGMPPFSSLDGKLQKLLGSEGVRIVANPHEPFYYYDSNDQLTGFEFDIATKVFQHIAEAYGHDMHPEFKIDWLDIEIETAGDGTENTDMTAALNDALADPEQKIDMVYSGTFTNFIRANYEMNDSTLQEEGEGNHSVDYTDPTAVFYIGALYTGAGGFGTPPTGNLSEVCKWFAKRSSEESPIVVISTGNGNQSSSAKTIIDMINDSPNGHAEWREIQVEEIQIAVSLGTEGTDHIYAGDLIQIQRSAKENVDAVDLDVNVLYDTLEDGSYRVYCPYTEADV